MSAITVENLSKAYRLQPSGGAPSYRTLRDELANWLSPAAWGRARRAELFWALDDINFQVESGQVLGVIGRNGAGKSTLLKIMSRITRPTRGRVRLRGRVASLLEVGTGFHSELTGRENIFLNGAILGLSRREIARKFDQIVAFAEIGEFLDTPVKRYSSGMYVRLAFAVAAHLESEIVLVDEVLAVGDMAFQQKCLGKMREVSRSGRTVLFVSHNMSTIASLCEVAIRLDAGRMAAWGPASEQVSEYIRSLNLQCNTNLADRTDRSGNGAARLTRAQFLDSLGHEVNQILSGDPLSVQLTYRGGDALTNASIHIAIYNDLGAPVTFLSSSYSGDPLGKLPAAGRLVCQIPQLPLAPGEYLLNVCLQSDDRDVDHIAGAARLQVAPGCFFRSGKTPPAAYGHFLCQHSWSAAESLPAPVPAPAGAASAGRG